MQEQNEPFVPGQRWVSETEPELGLGTILGLEGRRLTIMFMASGEMRHYAAKGAPLRRVRFAVGDSLNDAEGQSHQVDRLTETDGLITYHCGSSDIPEGQLSEQLSFSRPQDRLLHGHLDDSAAASLRKEVLKRQRQYCDSGLRGLLGGRIDLIPHQLYVVDSVIRRSLPRVLLADEIGLGKTIEACMILHHGLLSGRVRRALIVLPPALIHQWFVELLRRFSLHPVIMDAKHNSKSDNPFLDEQLVICSLDQLTEDFEMLDQAEAAGWDLLIVDEAHHLEWTEESASPAYQAVERLATVSHGLLLLSATPEETGEAGHFARLRLLDPERYQSLPSFLEEQKSYQPYINLAEKLESDKPLTAANKKQLKQLKMDPKLPREALLDELIDNYGPGRVILRNTRRIIKGFPKRKPQLIPLESAEDRYALPARLLEELGDEKILAIVHSRKDAQTFYDAIKKRSGADIALFHEDMTLIQRDRQAAWFADPNGARMLVASEIGGEGRNFQFAHHLLMLDLPNNPEMIEQRIGRLDRIGQHADINIHIPYIKNSSEELLARWLHEGLDAFGQPLPGAHEIYRQFHDRLAKEPAPGSAAWKKLLTDSKKQRKIIAERILHGRDRLLELQSFRGDRAAQQVTALQEADENRELDNFLLRLLESCSAYPEQIEERLWHLPADSFFKECIPAFPTDGMYATFDRSMALEREDLAFITWDHPLVQHSIEHMLVSTAGNATAALQRIQGAPPLLIEAVYVLQATETGSQAPIHLSPTGIVVMTDALGQPAEHPNPLVLHDLNALDPEQRGVLQKLLPKLLKRSKKMAEEQAQIHRQAATEKLEAAASTELQRLRHLQQRNNQISEREIEAAEEQFATALEELKQAPLRLDSLRCIFNTRI